MRGTFVPEYVSFEKQALRGIKRRLETALAAAPQIAGARPTSHTAVNRVEARGPGADAA